MARRLPQPTRGAAALALNVLLGLAALGLAFAPPGEGAPKLRLASASGAITLVNSKEGLAILQPGEMRPGETVTGSVTIANAGTLNAALALQPELRADVPGHGGGELSGTLDVVVVDVTLPDAPVTVYDGTLKRMGATNVGSLAPGAARTYTFEATIRSQGGSDNDYQGAAVAAGFRWSATGTGTAPPDPTATPSPTAVPTAPATPPVAAPDPGGSRSPGGGSAPAAAVPPLPASADPTGERLGEQLFALPVSRKCVSRRKFAIHVRRPAGVAYRALAVTVNGRTKVRLKGLKARKVKAKVNLKGLPAGKMTVKITATLSNGRKAVSTRTYRTCAAKKPKPRKRGRRR